MHNRVSSRFSDVSLKLKSVGKRWDSNPYLGLQNPVVLPTVPWEQLEFMTNISAIIKFCDSTEIQTRTYCLKNVCSHRTADTIYLKTKKVGKNTLVKK